MDGDVCTIMIRVLRVMKEQFDCDNILRDLQRTPGVDPISEKVFETAHPYERGKPQYFEETHFPGALALAVELDQRCSSDPSHDFLTISAWYAE
jgi:hypothetical protein